MDIKAIDQLVHLAWQFGPFAFALIFLVGMAMWGQKIWEKVTTRKNPPAHEDEKNTYRFYFIAMTAIGVVLVGISVFWWWTHQPAYFWEGQIESLAETDTIEGKNIFVRNEYQQQAVGSPQFRDVYFLIKQSKPFEDGQEIDLRYFRDRRLAKPLVISVAMNESPTFRLHYDDEKDEWQLVKRTRKAAAKKAEFFSQAFAQTNRAVIPVPSRPVEFPPRTFDGWKTPPPPPPSVDCAVSVTISPALQVLVRELQAQNTLVSKKVILLDALSVASQEDFRSLFLLRKISDETIPEPVFVTLMDLTRHTDKEVSSKARRVLTKAPLATDYFQTALVNSIKCRADAINAFLRLEPKYAEAVLADLERRNTPTTIYRQVARDGSWLPLVPTGTPAGDKYFVQAVWDSSGTNVAWCLENPLFFKDLELQTPFGMSGGHHYEITATSPWLVATPDKARAVRAAGSMKRCGANVSFVGYYPPN